MSIGDEEERNMPPVRKLKRKASFPQSPNQESPIRVIACLKKIDDMRRFEETDDCFILGFDPYDSIPPVVNDSAKSHHQKHDSDDVCFVGEKGQIALRDYPHSRNLCLKFPFKSTPHKSYCEMCYCFVCDSAAPCKFWTSHCDADNAALWKDMRKAVKQSSL